MLQIPMLIEAVCGYKVKSECEVGSIEEIRFVDLGTPLTERDCIVCGEGLISLFGDQVLVFRVSGSLQNGKEGCRLSTLQPSPVSKVFSVERQAHSSVDPPGSEIKKTASITREFESIYPTTDIYCTGGSLTFVLEQPSRTTKQIVSELRRMHPTLSMSNGKYVTELSENKDIYIVKCADGEVCADISVLKRENVRRFYHNNNSSSTCLAIGRDCDGKETCYTGNSLMSGMQIHNIVMDSPEELETIFEFSRSKEYIVLIKAFLKKLKPSRYCFVKHFYIQSIDGFYFTAFKVGHAIALIMSRKLYDYTRLANILHLFCRNLDASYTTTDRQCATQDRAEETSSSSLGVGDFCRLCLSIPDLSQDGPLAITYRKESLTTRYRVEKDGEVLTPILRSLFECDGVVLEEDENSFWNIQSVINSLHPLKFPGLIVSPLSNEMRYLLEGPYPFIISSEEWVEPKSKYIRAFKVPASKNEGCCKRCSGHHTSTGPNMKRQNTSDGKQPRDSRIVRSLRSMIKGLAGIGRKEGAASRADLFLKDKGKFIDKIVSAKSCYFLSHDRRLSFGILSGASSSSGKTFPVSFDAPTLIEKYFVNEIRPFSCTYAFDLSGKIESFPQAKMSIRSALSLWMMVYPGEIDYELLLKSKDCDVLYLARRACIDRNVEVIQEILRRASRSGDVPRPWKSKNADKLSQEQKRCSRGIPKSLSPLTRIYASKRTSGSSRLKKTVKLNDILSVIGNYDRWDLHEVSSRLVKEPHNNTNLEECSLGKMQDSATTIIEHPDGVRVCYKDSMYNLMTIENILGCIYNGLYNDQLRASTEAYFLEANLPAQPSNYAGSGDLTITLL